MRLGGGVATIQQYLRTGLVDEMHLAIAPVLLGSGQHLLGGVDLVKLGYPGAPSTCRRPTRPTSSSRRREPWPGEGLELTGRGVYA